MSAYLCNDWHFQYIAAYYLHAMGSDSIVSTYSTETKNLQTVAGILKAENHRSLAYRYPDTDGTEWIEGSATDRSMVQLYRSFGRSLSVEVVHVSLVRMNTVASDMMNNRNWRGQLAKALSCYEYQACEHPEWRDSHAYRLIVEPLRAWLLRGLVGYKTAPWGAPDDLRRKAA